MKYKVLSAFACAVMLLITSINLPLLFTHDTGRYHQHLETDDKKPCSHKTETFCTHLPLMSIDTSGVEIPGKAIIKGHKTVGYTTASDGSDRINATMSVFDSKKHNNHITDKPDVTSSITIHIRGNSSRTFDKPGYRIKLIDKKGESNPLSLMGMDSHQDWALHGPFLDKTLIRNYMWYNIAGEIMDYAPNVRFCELMLNGEYMGVYVLVETITAGKDSGRLNLSIDAKDNTFTGYLLLLDRFNKDKTGRVETDHLKSFTTYALRTKHKLSVVYPGEGKLNDEMLNNIKDDFSAFEKTIYSYDYDNNEYGYKKLIDVDSFVDYFLINEFTCNYDAGWLSTFIYKDIDGKFRMCIWDFNSACDNYQQSMLEPHHFEMQNCLWYFMLMKDEDFTQRCVERYRELRKTFLNEEYLNNYIDSVADYLGPAIKRNYEKWGYTFDEKYDLLKPAERNPRTYEQSIENMKNFISIRGKWMDENIEILKQYSAVSKVKKFNEHAN